MQALDVAFKSADKNLQVSQVHLKTREKGKMDKTLD